jgi:hypothetical protein
MKTNRRVTGTASIEREPDTTRMSAIIRNSYTIEFDQLIPLLLHLLQLILIELHRKRVMESNKPMCFEPPSLPSIDFVRVTLLFFSLRRELQPRLRIGEHTAPT